MFNHSAIIAVDVQRGFIPTDEGQRLHVEGFGELGVPGGEAIIQPFNRLLGWAALHHFNSVSTQDWHPDETAHFAAAGEAPNFTSTWPKHCVDGTPGAELHPELRLPASNTRFIKGTEALKRGEDDLSYSGYYSHDPTTGLTLPEWLSGRRITAVAVGGLALDYCVGSTVYDLRTKAGLDVTLLRNLTRPVTEATGEAMIAKLEAAGVHVMSSEEYMAKIEAMAA